MEGACAAARRMAAVHLLCERARMPSNAAPCRGTQTLLVAAALADLLPPACTTQTQPRQAQALRQELVAAQERAHQLSQRVEELQGQVEARARVEGKNQALEREVARLTDESISLRAALQHAARGRPSSFAVAHAAGGDGAGEDAHSLSPYAPRAGSPERSISFNTLTPPPAAPAPAFGAAAAAVGQEACGATPHSLLRSSSLRHARSHSEQQHSADAYGAAAAATEGAMPAVQLSDWVRQQQHEAQPSRSASTAAAAAGGSPFAAHSSDMQPLSAQHSRASAVAAGVAALSRAAPSSSLAMQAVAASTVPRGSKAAIVEAVLQRHRAGSSVQAIAGLDSGSTARERQPSLAAVLARPQQQQQQQAGGLDPADRLSGGPSTASLGTGGSRSALIASVLQKHRQRRQSQDLLGSEPSSASLSRQGSLSSRGMLPSDRASLVAAVLAKRRQQGSLVSSAAASPRVTAYHG